VRRYLFDDRIVSREQAEERIQNSLASFLTHGFGLWAVHCEGVMIGFCGLSPSRTASEAEILYGIAPSHWERGLATEAAQAVLRYGLEDLRLPRIIGGADVPNVASLRILKKLGMTFIRRERTDYGEVEYFALTREEFLKNRQAH
jgi:RimJ/RimL family protein N-acetyltransferase